MDAGKLDDLRAELAALEEEEARVSAERRHLHHQIDFGYATETTREREREVSAHRRELHVRIDALRARLGTTARPKQAAVETTFDQVSGGMEELERIADVTQRIDAAADDPPLL
jgi:regulator of replication initiation timing